MLICDDVSLSKTIDERVTISGLLNTIASLPGAKFPLSVGFCRYLELSGARGPGEGQIVVTHVDSEDQVYLGRKHRFDMSTDPLVIYAFTIRVLQCSIPRRGLYAVEFRFNDVLAGQQSLIVR
jgi:hypothetical protein